MQARFFFSGCCPFSAGITVRNHRSTHKPVEFVVGTPRKRKKRTRERVYDDQVQRALRKLWEFFDYQCGKRLVVLIRANMELLKAEPEFDSDETIASKLCNISAATLDRSGPSRLSWKKTARHSFLKRPIRAGSSTDATEVSNERHL